MERRKCPDGCVGYEIIPYTFSDGILNENMHYCPVCGKELIHEGVSEECGFSWIKEQSQSYTLN